MNLNSNLPSRILSRQFPGAHLNFCAEPCSRTNSDVPSGLEVLEINAIPGLKAWAIVKCLFETCQKVRFAEFSALALALLFASAPSLLGQAAYITTNSFNGVSLLPPAPVAGSAEEVADLASVRAVFNGRTEAEKSRAIKSSSLAFSLFQPAVGATFDLDKLPKTKALLEKVKKDIGPVIDASKSHFKRLRPYQLDERLVLGPAEPSFSYPSGHSTRGTVYSLVIAELFPEKKDGVLVIGRDIGWDRVLIGKHFPTDVYAGRVLGYAIVRELHSNTLFQHDLEQAMAEVRDAEHHVVPAEIAK
jgi:acid phosphatase (class A)